MRPKKKQDGQSQPSTLFFHLVNPYAMSSAPVISARNSSFESVS